MTTSNTDEVTTSDYQRAVANYWNTNTNDPVNLELGHWELRDQSSVRTGIEPSFLTSYREGSFHYLLIVADRIRP